MPPDSAIDHLALKSIPFGVVLLAERGVSLIETRNDLENIAALGFNTVVLYPSVSRWDADIPGDLAFDTIDSILDVCAELNLQVILELQGQVMQDADAPESSGYAQASNYRENGFHQPAKEVLLATYLRAVAAHFRGHPALLAYDLFNEVGNHSRSPETIQAFTEYLAGQYDGNIQALNHAWATYFPDFESITRVPPNYRVWSWSSVVAERDWQRFRSADFATQIRRWRVIIREVDPDTPLFVDVLGSDVLHNRTDDYFGVSDWDISETTDILGLSCYANMLGPRWWESDAWQWPQFWRHAISVADGKQTMISELMTANRSLFPTEGSSMTDEIGLWSYQAVFHGIQGMIYWKYRPFRRGRQVSGRGLTDFDGTPNRHAHQASKVAKFVVENAVSLAESHPDTAGCAIVFDPDMERLFSAIGEGEATVPPKPFYTDTHRGWFQAFWKSGIAPCYLTPARIAAQGIPAAIRVLVVPCLPGITTEFAESIRDFVQRGGTLVTESRFGLLDIDGNLQPHAPGFGLQEITGFEERGFHCRGEHRIPLPESELVLQGDYFQEIDCPADTEILVATESNHPALVQRSASTGQCLHVPFLLGHKVERGESHSQALTYFNVLLERLRPHLTPSVVVREKSPLLDISVLLRANGTPWLIGLTNFDHATGTVTLRLPKGTELAENTPFDNLTKEGRTITVTLPKRSAHAVKLA
ncbi:beta-galactosidase [Puniceicoccus vermicola]|uniref:beta-galactosidase n=1 Tax=Puniceicoccus vermicola TaxID=388746 RepID=A0A7X1AX75_9BACT|nr:beta-galactosidase [Puniceicoccus vermicola]MBC2601587.1 beta-galactosidase [Puniceicoccus vermicola]